MKGLACFALLPAALAGNQANLRSRRLREHAAGDAAEVAAPAASHAQQTNASRAAFPEEWLKRWPQSELEKSQAEADKWAQDVREAMLVSWKNYKERAWGHDEIAPISGGAKDWVGMSVSMLDALSTLYLMGLKDEFEDAARFIESEEMPSTTEDHGENSFFEVTIRALGGLMGAWSLSGEPVFRDTARRLGNNMYSAFNTPSGMPAHSVDVGTGYFQQDSGVVLAEAGTLQMEWGALSEATNDSKYIAAADRSEDAVLKASGGSGLVPVTLTGNSQTPRFSTRKTSVGAAGDSYYEYLLKHWIQTGKKQTALKDKWRQSMEEMQRSLVGRTAGGRTFLAQIDDMGEVRTDMDHLSCFVPGMLMLGSRTLPAKEVDPAWEPLAAELAETCYEMYNRTATGLAPEYFTFHLEAPAGQDMEIPEDAPQNMLRPETAESLFYMHYYTGDPKYRRMARNIFNAIQKHSRAPYGYAQVKDVREVPTTLEDTEPTWWFAETMKYLFLTFAPRETLDLDRWVLNTEAHPLKIEL